MKLATVGYERDTQPAVIERLKAVVQGMVP